MTSSAPVETLRYRAPGSASRRLYERACEVLPGGNTRSTIFMDPYPVYAVAGRGALVRDADGDERLDFLNNYTSLIHGHADPSIGRAVREQLDRGTAFALPTAHEIALAEELSRRVRSLERIRFTNSGTEAVMMAIKVARAYTGRQKIAKFEGAYHGSYDWAQVSEKAEDGDWGEAAAPNSVVAFGDARAVADDVLALPFNRPDACRALLERHGPSLAAVLVDPFPNRIGLIPASDELLGLVRESTTKHGALLIFDEVISFRVGYHGAQGVVGIQPDLTTLGKIIGGGFPVGAVGGRADIMSLFDPRGSAPIVDHGGTFNANPITMVAGLTAMQQLPPPELERLNRLGDELRDELNGVFRRLRTPGHVLGRGSLFRVHLKDGPLVDYRDTLLAPPGRAEQRELHRALLDRGIFMARSGLGCLSTPMTEHEVERLVSAFHDGLRYVRSRN